MLVAKKAVWMHRKNTVITVVGKSIKVSSFKACDEA